MKFRFLLPMFLFIFSVLLFPSFVNAQSLSGYFNMYYVKSTNSGTIPQSYTSTLGFNFPTNNYTQLAGSTISGNTSQHQFSVITQAQIAPTFNFTKGNIYTITLNFDTGSYIIPYFPTNNSNWFVSACTNGICSYQNATTTYSYTIDSTHTTTNTLQLVIKFTASATGSTTITIGNLTDNSGVFYNQFSVQQGIRISSASIDEVEQSVDLSPVVDAQNQTTDAVNNNTQAVRDIDSTLKDSTIRPEAASGFFDGLDFFDDDTLSGVITAPLQFINSLDDTCSPVVFEIWGKIITIPCGDQIFWNRPEISTFRNFWNILFGGFLIYKLAFKLFKVVNDVLDPTKDDIGGVSV